ncbi:MAG: ThuA domain-containing protein [Chloroflexi bacterium]|nr:ThuA domain-containing protein [Chloroflexota bacterium]
MNLLVLSGGRHPYEESTPVLEGFLTGAGHEVNVTEDASILADADAMNDYDALVFNTMRAGDDAMTREQQAGMTRFINDGKGFVCIHIAGCASADWPEYYDITGGGWLLSDSYHPPYGKFEVNITDADSPGAAGISDFETNDELYMGIEFKDGNDVFMTGDSEDGTWIWRGEETFMPGGTFPLGWTRQFGNGKVFVTLLGHNGLSFETPEFQRVVLNGIDWTTS